MQIPAIGTAPGLFVNATGQERPALVAAQGAEDGAGDGGGVDAVPRSEEEGGVSVDLGSRDDAEGEPRAGPPGSLVDISA